MSNSVSPWQLILLASIYAITPLAIDTYLPAMPSIAQDLQTPIHGVQQSLSIFLGFYSLGMLVFGPLADSLGRRPLALFGITGFALASLFLINASTLNGFLAGRALQAFCGAAATVVIPGVIRARYQSQTAKGMSYISMIMMLAPLLAPSIGSGILMIGSWHQIFMLLCGYALLLILCMYRYFPKDERRVKNQPIQFFSHYRVVFSQASARPLIATVMCSSFAFFCYLTAVPFIYLTYFGQSPSAFGVLFAINVIALMLANFLNSRLLNIFPAAKLVTYAVTLACLLAIALVVVSIWRLSLWPTVIIIAPLLACISIIGTNTDAQIILQFPQHAGTATAVTGTLRFGCGALAGPLLASTFNATAIPFAVMMLVSIIGVFVCQFWLKQQSAT